MPSATPTFGPSLWKLPPLILHPFNERISPATLLENSKASLMLAGLSPNDGSDPEELHRRVLAGRHAEVRMLFFLGKDVMRWIGQCMEWTEREPGLRAARIRPQSFARLLTAPPQPVKEKLTRWGVADYVSIFSRAIGLHTLFLQPPVFDTLAGEFLRSYHRYADSLYQCYIQGEPHMAIDARNFQFELYASSEYARLLETEWGRGEGEIEDRH